MLTNQELEAIEKKYFDILSDMLGKNIGQIITQINSQDHISGAATGRVTNVIESAVENILEGLIATQLHWNVCSMPVSSDSCFECGDAIVHIDAKTIKKTDNDNVYDKINVEASQTTYVKGTPLVVAAKPWEPKLNQYEDHALFGNIPNVTYILKIIYSTPANTHQIDKIKLISLPHGQLNALFGGNAILNAGRDKRGATRKNIRFDETNITNVENWRVSTIYTRY